MPKTHVNLTFTFLIGTRRRITLFRPSCHQPEFDLECLTIQEWVQAKLQPGDSDDHVVNAIAEEFQFLRMVKIENTSHMGGGAVAENIFDRVA